MTINMNNYFYLLPLQIRKVHSKKEIQESSPNRKPSKTYWLFCSWLNCLLVQVLKCVRWENLRIFVWNESFLITLLFCFKHLDKILYIRTFLLLKLFLLIWLILYLFVYSLIQSYCYDALVSWKKNFRNHIIF